MTIYEDEIDLRPYIDGILKHWWKIGLLAISLAVLVFVFTILQAPSYKATATMLVPHSQLQLSLADQFPTVVNAGDANSRMDAYLSIAQSDLIASKTYQSLKDILPEEYTVGDLKDSVEASNTGDAILITATAPTSQLAAKIANEWAKQTVQAINLAYSGEQPLEELQLQLGAAAEKYQTTQKELETFIELNPITELQTTLALAETALNSYIADQVWQVNYLYQQKQQFTQISDQANFIKDQVESGNTSQAGDVGDALAVMTARARTFSTDNAPPVDSAVDSSLATPNTPNNFGLQITDPASLVDSSANYAKDINTVIQISDAEYLKITQDLDTLLSNASYLGYEEAYTALTSEIQMLKAQLENLTARELELTNERDLAWNTYQVLLQKETEIKTTAQTNPVVTFASPAIPPEESEARQTIMKTAIAAILGGMIGVLWVVIRMWWQSSQFSDENNSVSTEG